MTTMRYNNAMFLAKFGTPEHRKKLMGHPDDDVASVSAFHADESEHPTWHEHFDRMTQNRNPQVREIAAIHGTEDHRYKLLDDPDGDVRAAVAERGNWSQVTHLKNDHDLGVKHYANKRLRELNKNESVFKRIANLIKE